MINFKENEDTQEVEEEFDYLNEKPLEEEVLEFEDEEPDYCD
jgi:hypothetical protein